MRSIIILVCFLLSTHLTANTIKVNVLTLSSIPLAENAKIETISPKTKLNIKISNLDDVHNFTRMLNQAAMSPRLVEHAIQKNKTRLKDAGIGIGLATALQIHELPAIVFQNRYIVYGTTDVLQAFTAYHTWLMEKAE